MPLILAIQFNTGILQNLDSGFFSRDPQSAIDGLPCLNASSESGWRVMSPGQLLQQSMTDLQRRPRPVGDVRALQQRN